MRIDTFGADDAGRLASLAQSPESGHRYLAAMIKAGPAAYIDNAQVQLGALIVDDKTLPLVVSDRVAGNSNICSAYAHYFEYAMHEFSKRYRQIPPRLLHFATSLAAAIVHDKSIDQIVFVNNWLFSTNPNHGLSQEQVGLLTSYLIQRHPKSAIVFRSINPMFDPGGYFALAGNRYRMVPSRMVYVFDGRRVEAMEHANLRRDLRQLEQTLYSITNSRRDMMPHVDRLAALYRSLYDRHSPHNPHLSGRFIALTMETRLVEYQALLDDDRVEAFVSFYRKGGLITALSIGYNPQHPQKVGLYRLAFAIFLEKAARAGTMVNLSAGAGEFKMLRGAVPVQEYDAVYDYHLPMRRRLQWQGLRMAAKAGSLFSPRT